MLNKVWLRRPPAVRGVWFLSKDGLGDGTHTPTCVAGQAAQRDFGAGCRVSHATDPTLLKWSCCCCCCCIGTFLSSQNCLRVPELEGVTYSSPQPEGADGTAREPHSLPPSLPPSLIPHSDIIQGAVPTPLSTPIISP